MSQQPDLEDPFRVVEFVNDVLDNGLKSIEIVPSTWVVVTNDKTGTCAFPGKKEYNLLPNLVQSLASPDTSWKKFDVELLVSAGNYKQAQRRLKRLMKSRTDVESVDSEIENRQHYTVSKKKAAKILNRQYSVLTDISEHGENSQSSSNDKHDDQATNSPENNEPIPEVMPKQKSTTESSNDPESKAEKKKVLRDRLKELREEAAKDPMKKFISDYSDATMELFTFKFRDDLALLKRAQQYELGRRVEEIKVSVLANATMATSNSAKSPREALKTKFPIENLESFLNFEKVLTPEQNDDPETAMKQQSLLKDFMKVLTAGSTDYTTDIKTIGNNLIDPFVQDLYSGAGRIVKGKGKRKFNATFTYRCMTEFIEGKYKDSNVPLKILTITSDWLAGSGDRRGRCAARKKSAAEGH